MGDVLRLVGYLTNYNNNSLVGNLNSSENRLSGNLTIPQSAYEPYVLPPATTSTLGGVIVGDNLLVTEEGVLSVDVADSAEQDNTRPITAGAVYAEIGNINVLLSTI